MSNIFGVNPPVVTLFNPDGSFDFEANKKLADFLIDHGVNGLAYFGTSGEFSVLTVEEKKTFLKTMIDYVNRRVNVLAGIGSTCLSDTLELAKFAEEAGADAVLLINPYFSVYEESMVESYYDAVASEINLPIIIYNFPGITGFNFSFDLVRKLALKHENIIGIKDTIDDASHIRKLLDIKKEKPEFRVFSAFENQGIGSLMDGVDGFINATANFAPEFTVGLYKAFSEKDFEKSMYYYEKMCDAMAVYTYSTPLFLACKQAVYDRVIGKQCAEHLPAVSLKDDVKKDIHEELKKLELI